MLKKNLVCKNLSFWKLSKKYSTNWHFKNKIICMVDNWIGWVDNTEKCHKCKKNGTFKFSLFFLVRRIWQIYLIQRHLLKVNHWKSITIFTFFLEKRGHLLQYEHILKLYLNFTKCQDKMKFNSHKIYVAKMVI